MKPPTPKVATAAAAAAFPYGLFYLLPLVSSGGVPGIKLRAASVQIDNQALPETRAIEGGQARLPCNLTRPANEDAVSLVLWYKGDGGAPMYSVDLRNAPNSSKHFSSTVLGSRARFDVQARPAVLRIDPVKAEDSGEYRCRVDYRWARTQTSVVYLTVVVSPREVRILDRDGTRLRKTAGPYNEGSEIRLYCEADRGEPRPKVSWWRKGELLDDVSEILSAEGRIRNELVIPRASRQDLGANLTCQASNSNLSDPAVAVITLDLNLKPLEVSIVNPRRPLSAGHGTSIQCQTHGSRPPARLTWWRDGTQVTDNVTHRVEGKEITWSTLYFWPTRHDHGVTLGCHADNPVLPGSVVKDTWMLDIYHKPEVSIHVDPPGRTKFREGGDVVLRCLARANPRPDHVGWEKDGVAIQGTVGEELVLRSVTRDHAGLYRCRGDNVEGSAYSPAMKVEIMFAPVCRPGLRDTYVVSRGETTPIVCAVDAVPEEDLAFVWTINGTALEGNSPASVTSEGPVSTLLFEWDGGEGLVTCSARNSVGAQRDPCRFVVLTGDPPAQPYDCLAASNGSVRCQKPSEGLVYHLEVYKGGRLVQNRSNPSAPEFVLLPSLATAGGELRLVVYSSNLRGRSRPVSLETFNSPPSLAENRSSLINGGEEGDIITPLLGAAIGAVLVSLLLVLVMILRRTTGALRRAAQQPHQPAEVSKGTSPVPSYGDLNGIPTHILPPESLRAAAAGPNLPPHPTASYMATITNQGIGWTREPAVMVGPRTTLM